MHVCSAIPFVHIEPKESFEPADTEYPHNKALRVIPFIFVSRSRTKVSYPGVHSGPKKCFCELVRGITTGRGNLAGSLPIRG